MIQGFRPEPLLFIGRNKQNLYFNRKQQIIIYSLIGGVRGGILVSLVPWAALTIHQMPRTPNASAFPHPTLHLFHMKLISPNPNVCFSHQIPQESPDTPDDIAPLVFELIPCFDLEQLNHLIPQVQDPPSQIKLLLTNTTTELRVHLSHQKYLPIISKKVFQFFLKFLFAQKIFSKKKLSVTKKNWNAF